MGCGCKGQAAPRAKPVANPAIVYVVEGGNQDGPTTFDLLADARSWAGKVGGKVVSRARG